MTAPTDADPALEPPTEGGRSARRHARDVAEAPASKREWRWSRAQRERRRRERSPRQLRRARTIGMSLTILALLCLCFVLTVSVLGALKASRDEKTAYDNFRYDLANGTAPVGQVDSNGALVEPGTAVAVLTIPSLGLDTVVVEGTTSGVLESGLGHRRDSLLPGQGGLSIVYGRRAAFGGPFHGLPALQRGAEIKAITGQGESTYRVVDVRHANDPVPPAAQKGRLLLVTADGRPYLPSGIVIVDADLVSDPMPADAKVITAASLAPAELPLQGDTAAWIGILLWAQALLIAAVVTVIAWARWGRWETWLVAIPVLFALGVATSAQVAQLLPNLL